MSGKRKLVFPSFKWTPRIIVDRPHILVALEMRDYRQMDSGLALHVTCFRQPANGEPVNPLVRIKTCDCKILLNTLIKCKESNQHIQLKFASTILYNCFQESTALIVTERFRTYAKTSVCSEQL